MQATREKHLGSFPHISCYYPNELVPQYLDIALKNISDEITAFNWVSSDLGEYQTSVYNEEISAKNR